MGPTCHTLLSLTLSLFSLFISLSPHVGKGGNGEGGGSGWRRRRRRELVVSERRCGGSSGGEEGRVVHGGGGGGGEAVWGPSTDDDDEGGIRGEARGERRAADRGGSRLRPPPPASTAAAAITPAACRSPPLEREGREAAPLSTSPLRHRHRPSTQTRHLLRQRPRRSVATAPSRSSTSAHRCRRWLPPPLASSAWLAASGRPGAPPPECLTVREREEE